MKFIPKQESIHLNKLRQLIYKTNEIRESLPQGRTFQQTTSEFKVASFVCWLFERTVKIYICDDTYRIACQLVDDKTMIVIHYGQTAAEARLLDDFPPPGSTRSKMRIPLRISQFGADADINMYYPLNFERYGMSEIPTLDPKILSDYRQVWVNNHNCTTEAPEDFKLLITALAELHNMEKDISFMAGNSTLEKQEPFKIKWSK